MLSLTHQVDKLCDPNYLIHYPMHGPVVSGLAPSGDNS